MEGSAMRLQAERRADRSRAEAELMRPVSAPSFADNRPATATLRGLSEAMNAGPRIAAQRKLADALNARPRAALQRKPPSHGTSLPVQRVITGNPRFRIYGRLTLSGPAQARLDSVATTLTTALHNDGNIQLGQIIISVEREGDLATYRGVASTIAGDNPAETTLIPNGVNPPDIEITLQRPFAEAATEGELLGMLAHEVGVHTIPTGLRGINDIGTAAFAPITTPRKIAKGNTASGGYEFNNWPAPAHGAAPASRDANRQHDHVMVADLLRNPPAYGGPLPLTRANVYFETMLSIGDTVWADATKSLAERTAQTTELVHLFLVDIARIIATDDGRMAPASHALAVSDVYGEMFDQVVLPYRPTHPWIPAARPKANVLTLGYSLWSFVDRVKSEKRRNG
jgi:hypothetical protein